MDSVADGLGKFQEMARQALNSQRVQNELSDILLETLFTGFGKKRVGSVAERWNLKKRSSKKDPAPAVPGRMTFPGNRRPAWIMVS